MRNIIVITLLTIASCNSGNSEQERTYLVSPHQFNELMTHENVVVLDVRTPEETNAGVINSPKIINFRDADFKDQIIALDKTKTYLVYCRSGGRSGQTKSIMDANGFKKVYDLNGGITSWKAAGLPVE